MTTFRTDAPLPLPAGWSTGWTTVPTEVVNSGGDVRVVFAGTRGEELHFAVPEALGPPGVLVCLGVDDATRRRLRSEVQAWAERHHAAVVALIRGPIPAIHPAVPRAVSLAHDGHHAEAVRVLSAAEPQCTVHVVAIAQTLIALGAFELLPERMRSVVSAWSTRGVLLSAAGVAVYARDEGFFERAIESAMSLPRYEPVAHDLARYALEAGAVELACRTATTLTERGFEPARELAARAALWRGDTAAVRRLAAGLERDTADRLSLHADCVHTDEPATQIERLERRLAEDPDDQASRLWLVELLCRDGRADAGLERFEKRFGEHVAEQLVMTAADPRCAGHYETLDAVERLGEPRAPVSQSRALELLHRFGGNRDQPLTVVDERGHLRWFHRNTRRAELIALQHRCRIDDPHEVARQLDAVADEERDNPFAATYAAELHLWLGDYERARHYFEMARVEHRARWGWIGEGAALHLLGRPREALATWADSTVEPLPYEATWVYRGEVHRLAGEHERARELFEFAAAQLPARVAVWPNLALVGLSLGDDGLVTRATTELRDRLSAIVADVEATLGLDPEAPSHGREFHERVLHQMRGNRGSQLYTFFDAGGRWRCVARDFLGFEPFPFTLAGQQKRS